MVRRPQAGDLVGVKRLGINGIVVESRSVALAERAFGVNVGAAVVLVEGAQQIYSWSDLYLIQGSDDDPADE